MRQIAYVLIFLSLASLLSGCGEEVISWRQKITVTVDTPQGRKSGSAVTQVTVNVRRSTGGLYSPQFHVVGEASALDLGFGKSIFALLSDESPHETARMAEALFGTEQWIGRTANTQAEVEDYFTGVPKFKGVRDISTFYQPSLVTFTSLSDPDTFTVLDPRNISKVLGTGYRFVSMTLEMTNEPPTNGKVVELLPWFSDAPPNLFENADTANRLPGTGKSSFVRE